MLAKHVHMLVSGFWEIWCSTVHIHVRHVVENEVTQQLNQFWMARATIFPTYDVA
jgi:hypothetical protein